MTEIEQLRKELNELRERVAVLERTARSFLPMSPPQAPAPYTSPFLPHYVVTCNSDERQKWVSENPINYVSAQL